MCYFCSGTEEDYGAYLASILALQRQAADLPSFLVCAAAADNLRFATSPEWAEPPIAASVRQRIFCNEDPDEGLLLFFLAAWLDLQAPYTRVWNQMLAHARDWLHTSAWSDPNAGLPRGAFQATRPHIIKTVRTLGAQAHNRSIASWLAAVIVGIAEQHSIRRGNIHRFVAAVCRDLYEAKDARFTAMIEQGVLPTEYAGSHYKRLWMLMMFLRKDLGAVRCLLRRALESSQRGSEALAYWEDDSYFDPAELELPVDTRVRAAWKALPFSSATDDSIEDIARAARLVARQASVSPASFDALLFFR